MSLRDPEFNSNTHSSFSSLRRSFSDTSIVASPPQVKSSNTKSSLRQSINGNSCSNGFWKAEGLFSSSRRKSKEWVIDLNDIDLIKTMGSGGTGEVWQGLWQGLDVAVKILYRQGGHVFGAAQEAKSPSPKQETKVERAFQAEVQSLSNLRHPNIVLFMGACRSHRQVMNVRNAELNYGIVTEYMSGGSIYDHIHKQDWLETASPALLRSITKDITLGMLYLHNEGIIHRDLKSRNILTNNNWHVKIADFDLSRIKQTTLYKNDPSSSLIGTPSWMAPELIQGFQYDEKVDVYSFAIVLFELLSGEIPFSSLYGREMNHVRIVYDVVKHGARPLLPDHISDPMKRLISKCWAQDPKERPDFAAILTVLNEENATEKYFCHVHNSHLLNEDEILSISARSMHTASTLKSSRSTTPSDPDSASDTLSASAQNQSESESASAQNQSEREATLTKDASIAVGKKKFTFSKWLKKLFKHHI